ncbi:DNA repair protein MmcB-like protein [compost metagenome]|nr:MAG TPA: DNA repair protein MmcB-like [Caudoviricetes sp.]
MTHDQLQEDLATHLRAGTDRMVWTNMQLGPSGSPRPDVFTVNKSFSRFRSDCYEIKVSVSDLRHDVTSGKWQSYRKFGHAVWFAFPRGMVELDLVPKECGIILRGETWRAARKPVAQVLDTLPRDTWLKLLMEGVPRFGNGAVVSRRSDVWHLEQVARKKFGDNIGDLLKERTYAESRFQAATEKLNASAEEIKKEVNERRTRAIADAERAQRSLDESMQELAHALGLEFKTASVRDLAIAVRQFQNNMQGRGLSQAIAQLQGLQAAMKEPVL